MDQTMLQPPHEWLDIVSGLNTVAHFSEWDVRTENELDVGVWVRKRADFRRG